MKKKTFSGIVCDKINKSAFSYLTRKIKSKGKGIEYNNSVNMQHYLRPNSILTLEDQRELFAYRTRMNNLKYNFPGNKEAEYCQCGEQMTNTQLLSCRILNDDLQHNYKYEDILNGNIVQQSEILKILRKNMKKFKIFSQAQDGAT